MEPIFTLITASITLIFLLCSCVVAKRTSKQQASVKPSTERSSSGSRESNRSKKQLNSRKRSIPPLELSFEASYEFALSLLKSASETGNFVISPFSFGAALAIVHDGAKDETQEELSKLLGKTLSPSDVSSLYSSLTTALSGKNSAVITSVANRIYLNEEFSLKSEYQSHIEKMYNASAKNINFEDGDTCAKDANSFVNETTCGMIPEVATADDFTDSVAVLINAVYFKGEWKIPFHKNLTKTKPFHGIKGDRDEQFMHASSRPSRYYLNDDVTVLSLDYKDSAFSLLVMMPSTDFGEWRTNLTAMQIHESMENLTAGKINLDLPKWKIESSTNGKEALEKCGVTKIFDKTADLSGISNDDIVISSIVHKAVIEVNEEGTEAAAATKVRIVKKFALSTPPVNLKFDRSFLYLLIREKHILFIGEFC